MAEPCTCATHPDTAINSSGLALLSSFSRPSWLYNFCSALSRILQVFIRMKSASANFPVASYPSSSKIPSMTSESYLFIWHPKVIMAAFFLFILDLSRESASQNIATGRGLVNISQF